jgi:hypothetical protein
MSTKEARRNRRIPYSGSVRISWEDARGPHFSMGRCIDISETGLRIELPVSIPLHTAVMLTAERIGLSGSASVKHLARFGAKHLIGLQLNGILPPKVRDALRDPQALRSPVSV